MKWIRVQEQLPRYPGDIVMAKRENGQEIKCYYHADSFLWRRFYGTKTSKWETYDSHQFLSDITHWKRIGENAVD